MDFTVISLFTGFAVASFLFCMSGFLLARKITYPFFPVFFGAVSLMVVNFLHYNGATAGRVGMVKNLREDVNYQVVAEVPAEAETSIVLLNPGIYGLVNPRELMVVQGLKQGAVKQGDLVRRVGEELYDAALLSPPPKPENLLWEKPVPSKEEKKNTPHLFE